MFGRLRMSTFRAILSNLVSGRFTSQANAPPPSPNPVFVISPCTQSHVLVRTVKLCLFKARSDQQSQYAANLQWTASMQRLEILHISAETQQSIAGCSRFAAECEPAFTQKYRGALNQSPLMLLFASIDVVKNSKCSLKRLENRLVHFEKECSLQCERVQLIALVN